MITLTANEALQLARLLTEHRSAPAGLIKWISVMDNHENWTFKVVTIRRQDDSQEEWILTDQGFARLNERET